MSPYSEYPNLCSPEFYAHLLVVRVPDWVNEVDEAMYLHLLEQRLQALLLATPMEELMTLNLETHETIPMSPHPRTEDLSDWKDWAEDWAKIILQESQSLQMMISEGMTNQSFPLPILNSHHPEFADLMNGHDETTLQEWLENLSGF